MDDIYDPLDEYANVFRDKFEQVLRTLLLGLPKRHRWM